MPPSTVGAVGWLPQGETDACPTCGANRLYRAVGLPSVGDLRQRRSVSSAGRGGHPRGGAQAVGKDYEFHRYDGAGHGFWYYHTERYRPRQTMDSWEKVFAFFGKHLGGQT